MAGLAAISARRDFPFGHGQCQDHARVERAIRVRCGHAPTPPFLLVHCAKISPRNHCTSLHSETDCGQLASPLLSC